MIDDFAIFICTHGRPNNQLTLNAILNAGYTGKWYLVLDDTDTSIQQYIDNYGVENIIVFDKNHFINTSDVGTINPSYKCILYAKNACEYIAKDLGLDAFVIADDDIHTVRFRWCEDNKLRSMRIVNTFDEVVSAYVDFLLTNDFAALGFGSTLMCFSGINVFDNENIQKLRVPYNFVFRNTSINIDWLSSYGEDVITAMIYGKIGYKWLALPFVQIDCNSPGESLSGGMSDTYINYRKDDPFGFKLTAYDFMYLPAGIQLILHRNKKWLCKIMKNRSFPKIISKDYKKEN